MKITDSHLRPGGTVSGPTMFALADVTGWEVKKYDVMEYGGWGVRGLPGRYDVLYRRWSSMPSTGVITSSSSTDDYAPADHELREDGVIGPGEKVRQKGLIFAATPASDFICGTLQLAAGMNLHVFTTGRGTPYGLAECPVIKVATRDDLARRWHDLMDVNAGRIATGEATIESVGWELFQLLLDTASGKRTWAEHWKLHNALVLFNPAPVT